MLNTLVATRFDRRTTRGRTSPFLMECEGDAGQPVEVIAKFTGPQLPVAGLVREALCALLAADLGLPVPACHCVQITSEFLDGLAASHLEDAAFLRAAVPLGFGSAKLPPGFAAWMPDRSIPRAMRAAAAEIYAFDLLIQNPDRRPDNPNLQSKGDQFAIFDHELALMTENQLLWRPPWEAGPLSTNSATSQHILHAGLKGSVPDLDRLTGAWEAIGDDRLATYRATLPLAWTANPAQAHTADTAVQFLRALRDHLRPALQEIMRILA